MKLLSVQLAIFSKDLIERPDLLFNEINKKIGGVINDIPTILNIPLEAPAEIPVVQAKSIDHQLNLNVSRSRIDFIINFDLESNKSPLEELNFQRSLINKFYQAVLARIIANRAGFIITMFESSSNNVSAIFNKYFKEKYSPNIVESSFRINKQYVKKPVTYNNICSVTATTVTNGTKKLEGVLFQYDLNNVLEQEKVINEDIISHILMRGTTLLDPKNIKEMI